MMGFTDGSNGSDDQEIYYEVLPEEIFKTEVAETTTTGYDDIQSEMKIEDYDVANFASIGMTICGAGILSSLVVIGFISILRKA